jgi:hypothetical protein
VKHERGGRAFLRKVIVTTLFGALSFPVTNLLFDSTAQQLIISAALGGVALIVQQLVEVEQRLAGVETRQIEHGDAVTKAVRDGFMNVNEATRLFGQVESAKLKINHLTQLAQKVASVGADAPPLISALARFEIERTIGFLDALAGHESTYDGEDHDFLLTLTRLAVERIDAVSLFTVDAGGRAFEGGFWDSDLGLRYLNLQHQAVVQRGVRIRRVFVINDHSTEGSAFEDIYRRQIAWGIDVRILSWSTIPVTMRHLLKDYIVFDNAVGYEVTPQIPTDDSANPLIAHTTMIFEETRVAADRQIYAQLWELASDVYAAAPVTGGSTP